MTSKSWDTPTSLWMNGKLVPWDDCRIHLTSPYAQRGASVFEGIRVYKTAKSDIYLALALSAHLERLENTWRALSLSQKYSLDQVRPAMIDLLSSRPVGDCYCRVTRFLDLPSGGQSGESDGLGVAIFQTARLFGTPVKCVIGSWQRNEFALPAHMKIGGNYFLLSWIRQQARKAGADDAILLNDKHCVAEATGTAVFILKDDCLVTPPVSDGALPSITARIVLGLAAQLGISSAVRSIPRTELFNAQAAFLAGSLDELRPITAIDGYELPNAVDANPVKTLFDAFSAICNGERDHTWGELLRITQQKC